MSKYHHQNTKKWNTARAKALKDTKYLCKNPFHLHDCILTTASEVHHIIPAEEHPELFYTSKNLIPLCFDCHKHAHKLLSNQRQEYIKIFEEVFALTLDKVNINPRGCYFDQQKDKYYCNCLKRFRQFPCSSCQTLTQSNLCK